MRSATRSSGVTIHDGGRGFRNVVISLAAALLFPLAAASTAEPDAGGLERTYESSVRPIVLRYCKRCHSDDRTEAEINLASMDTWAHARQHPQTWQKVREMLDTHQMPPRDAKQLTDADRTELETWVHGYLKFEARARAGDPGRVVLRRLSNAEYTYTLRDLTGVDTLDPAREFPVDGAAGEGFTNTGNALVMSPALVTKYLDAAKEIAAHAVLLPNGFRFSPSTTTRDWTEELLTQIRGLYREFADPRGGDRVNLQGIVFETNEGGRLPAERYLAATLGERMALKEGRKTVEGVAKELGLNAKYLGALWKDLTGSTSSLLLESLRARWSLAQPGDAAALAAEIAEWQKALSRFTSVGHIGKVGGPKRWLEPVDPVVTQADLRFKIPPPAGRADVTLTLLATDAGDGNEQDVVVWQRPRLVAPGRPDLLLRDLRRITWELTTRRERVLEDTSKYLDAVEEAAAAQGHADPDQLAAKHAVDAAPLRAWLDYLGVGVSGPVAVTGHFTNQLSNVGGYEFVKGWGSPETPSLVANSSDQHVRIPGNLRPHSVAVHPSPTLQTVVGWRSPVTAMVRVEGRVTHAHPECGNGVTWSLELRRGATRQKLASGVAQGATEVVVPPVERVTVQPGDLVSLKIGPRDGNHSCDLTAIDLKLTGTGDPGAIWNLADDVSSDIHAANPHADRQGHEGVWHFYTEPEKGGVEAGPAIPPGSILAKWQGAGDAGEKRKLAEELQGLLTSAPPAAAESADAALRRQLLSLGGPLFGGLLRGGNAKPVEPSSASAIDATGWGLDPALFGKRPDGKAMDSESLCVTAPSMIEIRIPADLAESCELVTTGALEKETGAEGSVQLEVVAGRPELRSALRPGLPVLVNEGTRARKRVESAFEDFRQLFPAALCYTKIVPVDEVVTLTLFYREDDHLARLMLEPAQVTRLDRLWDELHYVSHDALTLVDAFAQLMEYATQDADPKVFEPLRKPIHERAAAFRQRLIDTEPKHLDALIAFAGRAYRRPLTGAEGNELRALYGNLRSQEIGHEEAFRLTLARVLVAPAFLYRMEKPAPGAAQGPITGWELANRLSYFLWASQPDDELREVAAAGRLTEPDTLAAQMKRMLGDPRVRRLAIEFACQWLHIRDFDHLDEKSERHFPTFLAVRGAIYEESIQFFTDFFQSDRPVLDILDADHTFLNEDLARHYGIPGVSGAQWRRVDGVQKLARGGILGQAATLSKQSGASRTSPILRGNWISEVLLGERLPRPPKDVPRLPEDEAATEGLTVRQLVEKHTTDPKCSVCHERIDAFGFSLEGFDAIGRKREKDLGDRPIDTRVKTMDGAEFEGLDGLRNYISTTRRDAFLRQFCRKLLGYALGRAVQLSDEPLLDDLQVELKAKEYRVASAIELIVRSRQFREIRGTESAYNDE